MDGRLNFKATIDDADFNRKIGNMEKGVNGLEQKAVKMTKEQQKAYERLANTIKSNQDLLKNATDPTQIALYNQRIKEATASMQKLVATASKPIPVPNNGRVTAYNSQGNSIGQMQDALGSFKDRLAGERDVNNIKQLNANIQELEGNIKRTTNVGKKGFDDMGNAIPVKNMSRFGQMFSSIASSFGVFAGIGAVLGAISGAFRTIVEFDSKLLNVSKTTGLAGAELKSLGESMRALSDELRVVSVDKLLGYATVAGQLGVKGTSDIMAFTKALAMLETASNISGEEGGSQIARLLTLTDGGVQNVNNFGDEIVKLGNNFAATESEILKNATAIAQNTGVYKLGRQEVLAYGTATKSVGIEAEITGSTLGRTLGILENSIRTGKNVDNVMTITGKSVEDLKAQFKTDPQGVLYSFVKGLNEIDKSGGSVNNALESLGVTAVRDQRVISSLATGGFDVLTKALEDVANASGSMEAEFDTASTKIANSIESVKVSWENLVLAVNSSENEIGNTMSFWAIQLSNLIDWIARASTSWKELNRLAGTRGETGGFDFVMKRKEDISKNEAINQAFLLEQQARDLSATKKILETELADARWIDRGKINQKLEKVNEDLSNVNSQMIAYRNIAQGITAPTTKTTGTKTEEQLELEAQAQREKRERAQERSAESLAKKRLSLLDEIARVETDLSQTVLSGRELELSKITQKYDELIKKSKELGMSEKKINELRAKETEIVTYKADTEILKTSLEQQKTDYEAFEEYKKQVGVQKAKEMYSEVIDTSKSYYDVLNDELNSFSGREDLTALEKQRIDELFKLLQNYSTDRVNKERQDLQNLIQETATYQERISLIQETYSKKRKDLEKITDEQIRNEKLAVLNQQEKDAILSVENEVYEKGRLERDLIKSLTSYTKKELQNRLKSTQEFLSVGSESLSENQKKSLEAEIQLLESIIGATDAISRQNALLKEKERITKAIKNNTSKDPEIAKKLNKELEDVNGLISDNDKAVISTAEGIQMAVQGANMLAKAFGSTNKELQMAVEAIGNIVSALASGDMAGAVMAVAGTIIQGAVDVFGKNDTSARDSEKLRLQEEYNKMLRDQLLIEARINDEYQSRVQAIREEMEVLSGNQKSVISRMKEILNTFYELYKDFGGFGSVNDFDFFTGWQGSGLNEYFENGVELSDELLDKLIQLNNEAPLTGTMKELFDELMRLKEEFGSVDDAVKELEKELRDRLTGTTAQSLADSIREGIADGKRSFEDFANDIEGFLRNAILAGMSQKIIEPQIQQLQDMLYEMMQDGILTEEERRKFEDRYAEIAQQAGEYLDLVNQAGVNMGGLDDLDMQSAKDGIKRITESQADRLTGILTGMQVDVIESRKALQLSTNLLNSSLDNLIAIEFNTRRTYEGVERIEVILQNNQNQALGL